ncbi:hypothetical protein A7U60_g4069 [Sanghuangporus baumii]|uniref:Uncharacterized protein n=1 Tax=Sanghuangporus baumii TaxID=108892 RepID=A0A9Q5HZA2_SANBA|nr:hypothetical protein A7U60_g4069 [Sanghuangporus baumii]
MEEFTEVRTESSYESFGTNTNLAPGRKEYSRILQSKEWLVKVDNTRSVPYLLFGQKVYFPFILATPSFDAMIIASLDKEPVNSSLAASLIWDLHTLSGISDANFDIVESRDADLAFELDCDKFKWRWEAYLLGPKTSADVISKHLILPLISLTHVSFYSADPVSELAEGDLEKTVDKIGRTARRSVDIHVKQTLSRPRISTTLQRISSILGFVQTLPSIRSETERPNLEGQVEALRDHIAPSPDEASRPSFSTTGDTKWHQGVQNAVPPESVKPPIEAKVIQPAAADAESETESDSDDERDVLASKSRASQGSASRARATPPANLISEPPVSGQTSRLQSPDSDSPPAKKFRSKITNISDSDSDSDSRVKGRSQGSQGNTGGARPVIGRGVRQPLKRGGRRF